MVKFGTDTVAASMELGKEAAAYITSHFIQPIKLEFEKVCFLIIKFLSNSINHCSLFLFVRHIFEIRESLPLNPSQTPAIFDELRTSLKPFFLRVQIAGRH